MKLKMPIDWQRAVLRLATAGCRDIAELLSYWRNKLGGKGGWDGWLRGVAKRENRPELIEAVWG